MLPWSRIAISRSRQELGAVESRDRDDAGSFEPVALLPCSQQVPMLTIDYRSIIEQHGTRTARLMASLAMRHIRDEDPLRIMSCARSSSLHASIVFESYRI